MSDSGRSEVDVSGYLGVKDVVRCLDHASILILEDSAKKPNFADSVGVLSNINSIADIVRVLDK